jgi:hypothetical protein
MRRDTEIKQTVIAVLTSVRDDQASSAAELFTVLDTPASINATRETTEQARRQALTAATYAMSLFHMLSVDFESACPDVDVQAFLRRRALELVAGDEETA